MPRWEETSTGGEVVRAFVPDPPLRELPLEAGDIRLLTDAATALGRLDGYGRDLIDAGLFTYLYVRQEAVLSSQIEGTQSTLSDLLSHEQGLATKVPLNDVAEVSRYVAAMEHGLAQIRDPHGLPISLRLLRELHRILLSEGQGSQQQPGSFRTSQNWIGGPRPGLAAFVPPPPHHLDVLHSELERFLHDRNVTPLIRVAIAHAYFETLHPFLDGNGRVGRLLIPLLLIDEGVLREPHLYLSLYFKQHRSEYYERLQATRERDDWIGWLRFFLRAVKATAERAVEASIEARSLFERDLERADALPRSDSLRRVLRLMRRRPVVTAEIVTHEADVSQPTANSALSALEEAGMIEETTGKKRGRVYAYQRFINALASATSAA